MGEAPVALAYISAAAAAVGAVDSTATLAGSGTSGVNIGHCNVHYPKEFATEQFAHQGQSFERDVVKFHAPGLWDNDLAVSATGYVSNDNTALLGHSDSAHPNVPVNRFILLGFDKSASSQDMSSGLLTCNIELWGGASDLAEGSADDPWVALHVHGRFDPVGIGDVEYSFKLLINTFGHVHMSNEHMSGTSLLGHETITNQGDHVQVWLS